MKNYDTLSTIGITTARAATTSIYALMIATALSLAVQTSASAATMIEPHEYPAVQAAVDHLTHTNIDSFDLATISRADRRITTTRRDVYHLQMPFLENIGQVDNANVRFFAHTIGGTLFVAQDGTLTYDLPFKDQGGVVIKEMLTDRAVTVEGGTRSSAKMSYFKGIQRDQWRSNIPSYETLSMREVYDGIDLALIVRGNNVEKIFTVTPRGTLDSVRVRIAGAETLKVTERGELELATDFGAFRFTRPVAYQEAGQDKESVDIAYVVHGNDTYGFSVGVYDRTRPLIVDPLVASTLLGGSNLESGYSLVLGANGDLYLTGITQSSDYPVTSGAYDQTSKGDFDVFISRVDANLTSLLASTLIGGYGDDFGNSIALDGNGAVYVTGYTESSDYPTTATAYDQFSNGGNDIFVSKLNAGLTSLLASTFVGGSGAESGVEGAIDEAGNVYVVGHTNSSNYPTTSGAYDQSHNGGDWDIVVSKLDGDLSTLVASTFIGGSGWCYAEDIVVDGVGDVYIAGTSGCYGCLPYPTTPGAYDVSFNGDMDFFVSKLSGSLSSLLASTFIGGTGRDWPSSLTMDGSGNVFVAGVTTSSNYPTTSAAYDRTYGGGWDTVVSKLDGSLSALLASTYVGGSSREFGSGITTDEDDNLYLAGGSNSSNYPVTAGAYDESFNGGVDGVVSKFDNGLGSLLASTFIGGSEDDSTPCIAIDGSGKIYVAGITFSSDYPTTSQAYDRILDGGKDALVSRLDGDLSAGVDIGGIDIKPDSDPNAINPFGRGLIPVALLGSDTFDVANVNVTSLAFGPDGASPAHDLTDPATQEEHLLDVDQDGFMDLVSHYAVQETGIAMGDREACLTGETLDGIAFEGCDDIVTQRPTSGCGLGVELVLLISSLAWLYRMRRRSI